MQDDRLQSIDRQLFQFELRPQSIHFHCRALRLGKTNLCTIALAITVWGNN